MCLPFCRLGDLNPDLTYCDDVTGSYVSQDGIHELALFQTGETHLDGFYSNSTMVIAITMDGQLGQPNFPSRTLTVQTAGRDFVMTLAGS